MQMTCICHSYMAKRSWLWIAVSLLVTIPLSCQGCVGIQTFKRGPCPMSKGKASAWPGPPSNMTVEIGTGRIVHITVWPPSQESIDSVSGFQVELIWLRGCKGTYCRACLSKDTRNCTLTANSQIQFQHKLDSGPATISFVASSLPGSHMGSPAERAHPISRTVYVTEEPNDESDHAVQLFTSVVPSGLSYDIIATFSVKWNRYEVSLDKGTGSPYRYRVKILDYQKTGQYHRTAFYRLCDGFYKVKVKAIPFDNKNPCWTGRQPVDCRTVTSYLINVTNQAGCDCDATTAYCTPRQRSRFAPKTELSSGMKEERFTTVQGLLILLAIGMLGCFLGCVAALIFRRRHKRSTDPEQTADPCAGTESTSIWEGKASDTLDNQSSVLSNAGTIPTNGHLGVSTLSLTGTSFENGHENISFIQHL